MFALLILLLTALLAGIILSRATGYHAALTTFLDKRVELLSWNLMLFFSHKICEDSTPILSFMLASVTLVGSVVLLDGSLFASQEPPTLASKPLDPPETCPPEARFATANAAECREIIKSGTPPKASKNTLSALEARARPNQRLKLAFGIESCFTSSDEKSCKSFRTQVEKLLYAEQSEWVNFATTARDTADEALDAEEDNASLFRVVQLMTLKTMMRVLWPDRDPKQCTNEQISTLAHEVNLQWLRSKEIKTNDNPSWRFDKQISLGDAVKAVFPDWDETNSEHNPCNLILPGYETMWRVVLRCFIEITARHHDESYCWKHTVYDFVETPTKQQLEAPKLRYASEVTAIHIAKEALRLYPPTRRIYREYRSGDGQKIDVSADVEAMQRDSIVWKDEPNVFVPERWIGLEAGHDNSYMPFGASPFNCPAKRYKNVPMPFGPSMVALLAGALVEATLSRWDIHGDFPDKSCPLDTEREAYSAAVLERQRIMWEDDTSEEENT
jgi:hypothetical protein